MTSVRPLPAGRRGRLVAVVALATLTASPVLADAFDPPAAYYNAASGTGTVLRTNLYNITRTGFVSRDYGAARYAFELIDRDPANASRILLVYNRASVDGTWDQGVTFNREHVWPSSLLGAASPSNSYNGPASDLFDLRPSNPSINNNRGNLPFGLHTSATPAAGYGVVNGAYFNPGNADRGDVSRSIFYMATRYGQGQTNNLDLVDGPSPATYRMGDKQSLLRWHYADPVDAFERRRNQTIYSQADNPSYYQGNRNPYVDHPEYVWAVWGGAANTSKLTVAAAAGTPADPADGASSVELNFGKVISGASFGAARTVYLNKTGDTPTTFDVTATGGITATGTNVGVGPRQTFGYDPGQRSLAVNLTGATTTLGPRGGTIAVDNTDLTGVDGRGVADGNDVVTVTGTVVGHASPSLAANADVTSQTSEYGIFALGLPTESDAFQFANRAASGIYTAALDLDVVTPSGDASAFTLSDLAPLSGLAAGSFQTFTVAPRTDALGSFTATYSLATSDEDIPGATARATLALTVTATVARGGDTDVDGDVDFEDLLTFAGFYGNAGPGIAWGDGDFTRDASIDFADLLLLASNFNAGGLAAGLDGPVGSGAFAADWALARSLVPEPTILGTLGGLIAVIGRRRVRAHRGTGLRHV